MNNDIPTRAYFFDRIIDRNLFIRDTVKKFIQSQKKQLMLLYSEDISRTEVRNITYRITKAVRKQNPDVLIEVN